VPEGEAVTLSEIWRAWGFVGEETSLREKRALGIDDGWAFGDNRPKTGARKKDSQ